MSHETKSTQPRICRSTPPSLASMFLWPEVLKDCSNAQKPQKKLACWYTTKHLTQHHALHCGDKCKLKDWSQHSQQYVEHYLGQRFHLIKPYIYQNKVIVGPDICMRSVFYDWSKLVFVNATLKCRERALESKPTYWGCLPLQVLIIAVNDFANIFLVSILVVPSVLPFCPPTITTRNQTN